MKTARLSLAFVATAVALSGAYVMSTAAAVAATLYRAVMGDAPPAGFALGVNSFSKEVRVAFEEILSGFEDGCELSREVDVYRTDAKSMERSNNTIWIPQPYIATSYDGLDQTANFQNNTQLSVPLSLGYSKSVPWTMTAYELNDAVQSGKLGEAAKQKLSSDINVACSNIACLQGSIFVKRTAAPTGFDDVAECDSRMTEEGIQRFDRKMVLATRRYNSMASNLAARANVSGKVERAYETGQIGRVAGFDLMEAGYTYRLTAAAASATTINDATAANRRYIPRATSTAATGETGNVDNRFMNITIATTGTVKVGDAFQIAGVNSVHHITKADTGVAKTFRVTAIVSGGGGSGVVQITPPIISADSAPTAAELQYKNVTATPANGAAITWLNTVADNLSPFWVKGAIVLLPGRYSPPEGDAGLDVMRGTTKQGIELIMSRQGSINDLSSKYRMDVRFGVTAANTEMMGVEAFSQT